MTRIANVRQSNRLFLAAAVVLAGLLSLPPAARAQDDIQSLSYKLDRVQQQLSDLERQVYNGQPPAAGGAATGGVAASQ